jgi:aconitate hydratase
MAFDIDMIKGVYTRMASRIDAARRVLGKPLTLTEKILYSHLDEGEAAQAYARGESYVDFRPDRVAMQDATAQMALLQFMQAGKKRVTVPSTVHCDHLIQAKVGALADLKTANETNKEVYGFLASVSDKYGIGFWKPGAGIIHQVVLPGWDDDRDRFSYRECRRTWHGSHWCRRGRCCGRDGRNALGIEVS